MTSRRMLKLAVAQSLKASTGSLSDDREPWNQNG